MRQKSLVLGKLGDEALDSAANHGILSHQDDCLPSQRLADFVHLLRADIVDRDDEDGLVVLEQALELFEVDSFGPCLAPHVFFDTKLGCLRANWGWWIGCGCEGWFYELRQTILLVRENSAECQDSQSS